MKTHKAKPEMTMTSEYLLQYSLDWEIKKNTPPNLPSKKSKNKEFGANRIVFQMANSFDIN